MELLEEDFSQIKKEDYLKCLKYKNEYYILVNSKDKFQEKYPKVTIRKPTLEELMLLFGRGE